MKPQTRARLANAARSALKMNKVRITTGKEPWLQ